MHVVYLNTEDLAKDTAGGRVHFWAVAQGLTRLGCRVTVAGPRYRGAAMHLPDGVSGWFIAVPFKNALSLLLFELQLLIAVPWLVLRLRPDVVLVRGGGPGWIPGLVFLALRSLAVPVVLECNGITWEEFAKRGFSRLAVRLVRFSAWQQAKLCCRIVAVTREIGHAYCKLANRPLSDGVEIPNGVEPNDFAVSAEVRRQIRAELGFGTDELVVGFVGSFTQWHGIPEILDAAALLQQRGVQGIVFCCVGDGELLGSAKERIERDGLHTVRLFGKSSTRAQLHRWMASFDIGLCTNRPIHGSPLKFFEYLACGIPVVGSGAPQVLRIIRESQAGVAMEVPSASGIADAIQVIRLRPEEWRAVGHRNRELSVNVHSWQRVASRVCAVLSRTGVRPGGAIRTASAPGAFGDEVDGHGSSAVVVARMDSSLTGSAPKSV